MRLIKMFGLAAIAVAAVMAFVGVTSASAVTALEEVVLCKVNTSPCPAGNDFPSGTVVHGELKAGTSAVLDAGVFGKIICTGSTTLGTTTSLLVHGEITALAFTGCTFNNKSCSKVEPLHLNYLIKGELKPTDTGYEVLVTEKAGNGIPEVHVECPGVKCSFTSATTLLEQIAEAGDAVLKVEQKVTFLTPGLGDTCPALTEPTWNAEYLTRCLESPTVLVGCWIVME